MIASRKIDKLSTSAKLLQGQIKPGSPAELDHVQCNIRNEEQVCMQFSLIPSKHVFRARCYETFFMLNSAEHEIYPAHKC